MSLRAKQIRVIWLNGALGWGLAGAVIWFTGMRLLGSGEDPAEEIFVALTLFPMAGYIAGRMMWQDRLHRERDADRPFGDAEGLVGAPGQLSLLSAAYIVSPTWRRATQVWWALTWRGAVAMFVSVMLGALLGAIAGALVATFSIPTADLAAVSQGLAQAFGAVLGALVSIIPVKLVLGSDFGEFRLVLLGSRPLPLVDESPPLARAALAVDEPASAPEDRP